MLIKCSECGNEKVSTNAEKCTVCGCPIGRIIKDDRKKKAQAGELKCRKCGLLLGTHYIGVGTFEYEYESNYCETCLLKCKNCGESISKYSYKSKSGYCDNCYLEYTPEGQQRKKAGMKALAERVAEDAREVRRLEEKPIGLFGRDKYTQSAIDAAKKMLDNSSRYFYKEYGINWYEVLGE